MTTAGMKVTQESCAGPWDTLQGNTKHLLIFDLKYINVRREFQKYLNIKYF